MSHWFCFSPGHLGESVFSTSSQNLYDGSAELRISSLVLTNNLQGLWQPMDPTLSQISAQYFTKLNFHPCSIHNDERHPTGEKEKKEKKKVLIIIEYEKGHRWRGGHFPGSAKGQGCVVFCRGFHPSSTVHTGAGYMFTVQWKG